MRHASSCAGPAASSIGGDVTVTMVAEAGQLQLNVFEPIIAYRLLSGMTCLARACRILQDRCVEGITANRERMQMFVEQSVGVHCDRGLPPSHNNPLRVSL